MERGIYRAFKDNEQDRSRMYTKSAIDTDILIEFLLRQTLNDEDSFAIAHQNLPKFKMLKMVSPEPVP